MNMQQYFHYTLTYPECRQNLHEYATLSQLQAYIPQSADKLYLNMQQYFHYTLTYPECRQNLREYATLSQLQAYIQTNFISICSNSISATSLYTMHMHSADPINSFSSLTKNSARNQQP